MNTKLVDSIVQVIQSLPDEDRALLRSRLVIEIEQNQYESNLNIFPISALSDQQVIALTELQMETSQDQRLSQILQIQQERAITAVEQSELKILMEIYQAGLLRKAQALNESVKRGLRQPLSIYDK